MTPTAQGPWIDLALHTLGWKAFQDLCAHVCEDVLHRPVEIFQEAQDGGQDAVFLLRPIGKAQISAPGTVQCKFSSVASRTLNPSDLSAEEEKIKELVALGNAGTYVLLTNMSISAPVALKIRGRLQSLGVAKAHIFGKQFMTRVIRSSAKLRALVPQVYGLGDLSVILDQRRADQTRAVLGHMVPSLRSYVATRAHKDAVKYLSDYKIVLLSGDPASGKSTIAAVLATIAIENPNHKVIKADGPKDLIDNWNPHETGGFFWVDDAFGPNQLRQDYVDHWVSIMPKVQAAIANGNHFVLTSRRHIYMAAKHKLGTRKHPLVRDNKAVIEVGALTNDERRQILYNHVKNGNQPASWKLRVKKDLEEFAKEQLLSPEIARQIGDSAFTKNVWPSKDALLQFIKDNRPYLLQTIKELSAAHRAALTLVLLHRGRMPVGQPNVMMQEVVVRHYDVDRETLANSLQELMGSFLVEQGTANQREWTFKHPTLADALSATLSEADGMRELYLRGVKPETILSECASPNIPYLFDAIIIPESLDAVLLERLNEVPADDLHLSRLLFDFLANRASDSVFAAFVTSTPDIFDRRSNNHRQTAFNPRVEAFARAYQMKLLPDGAREAIAEELWDSVFDDYDTSMFAYDNIMSLMMTRQLIGLAAQVRTKLIPALEERISEFVDNADLTIEPKENFDDPQADIANLHELFAEAEEEISEVSDLEAAVKIGIRSVERAKADKEREDENDNWEWGEIATANSAANSRLVAPPPPPPPSGEVRSLFSDVDD